MIDLDFTLADIEHANVTPEQIGRCSKIYDEQLRAWVWMVESERDSLVEYKTYWSNGPHCSCPAGLTSFEKCRLGYCKHIAWIAAADAEEHAALAEQERARKATRTLRGYDIRYGYGHYDTDVVLHIWGKPGELPTEWTRICNDPLIKRACIFYSSQRRVKWAKRRFLARFDRTVAQMEVAS